MKQLVTEYHALNIQELSRGGWLYAFSKYDWVWRTCKKHQHTAIAITVFEDALRLTYPMGATRIQQDVCLTHSTGPRGGKRPWFLCPTCRQRVGILYHAEGLPFRCRICCDLVYPSQYESSSQSYGRQHRMIGNREREKLSESCAVGT